MENLEFDHATVNELMTKVASLFVKAGYRDEAYAIIALTKIIAYRTQPEYLIPEYDGDAMKEYNQCCDTLELFISDESKLELKRSIN